MPIDEVPTRLLAYFAAEKRESLLFLLAGLLALGVSIALFRSSSAYRGMLVPLALVGVIQVAVGGSVYARSDQQAEAARVRLAQAPAELHREEGARMEKVMANFRLYKLIEILIVGLGIGLVYGFRYGSGWHAAGIGCIAQGSLMLVLDLFAEGRGYKYLAALARLP